MKNVRWMAVGTLLVCVAVSIFCVAYPVFVIRPFRAQGARELAAALEVSRFRGVVTAVLAVVSVGCAIWLRRGWTVAGACVTVAMALLAHVNVYEIMFHPMKRLEFAAASAVKLDADEKVIAVKVGSVARAYPVRGLSYHHIANDVLEKVAIVATY